MNTVRENTFGYFLNKTIFLDLTILIFSHKNHDTFYFFILTIRKDQPEIFYDHRNPNRNNIASFENAL